MKEAYFESVVMVERVHRLFLEVINIELEKQSVHDINNVQALILYNIGEGQLSVGELTNRGYYLGSNVSYNLRKMVQYEYVEQLQSLHDKRSSFVKLSDKGLSLFKALDKAMTVQSDALKKDAPDVDILKFVDTLKKLEKFWSAFLTRF